MSLEAQLLEESVEELFEDAPCGYLSTRPDGTIIRVNRTFERWTGRRRDDLVGRARFQDLLAPGARIYYETHYAPLVQMQDAVREIAVDLMRADGSTLPALVNSDLKRDDSGQPALITTTVFDATDRRSYEQELLRVSEREHEIALALQRSLLEGEIPTAPNLEIEVFYASAARGLEIGGDWYDAFWLREPRTVALVVGDVVGRGLTAAMTMGQLRSAIRALASLELSPAALLDALDAYSRRHGVGAMTTLAYAEIDLETAELCFACAGHPPPLVIAPGTRPSFAWNGRSLPLNAYPVSNMRAEASLTVPPAATVLLYTDGVIEHRGRPADEGMELLSTLAAQQGGRPLDELVGGLVSGLSHPAPSDDRCLLAARIGGRASSPSFKHGP